MQWLMQSSGRCWSRSRSNQDEYGGVLKQWEPQQNIAKAKKISENILEDFLSIILDELIQNKKVKIPNFGSFILRNKKSRVGRNPKTLEKKIITERNVVLFRPSKELKNKLNNNE